MEHAGALMSQRVLLRDVQDAPILSLSSLHCSLKPVPLPLDQAVGQQLFEELAFAAWSGLPTEELSGDYWSLCCLLVAILQPVSLMRTT